MINKSKMAESTHMYSILLYNFVFLSRKKRAITVALSL
jgi:hypothetical protein